MENILIISPQAGYGNRIRSICSAMLIARQTNRTLYLLWSTQEDENSFTKDFMQMKSRDWSSYFKPNNNLLEINSSSTDLRCNYIFSEWLPNNKQWYPRQSGGQKFFLDKNPLIPLLPISKNEKCLCSPIHTILIETSKRIVLDPKYGGCGDQLEFDKEMSKIYQMNFIPQDKYIAYMREIPEYNIGISIRRASFELYFNDKCTSKSRIIIWILSLLSKTIKSNNPTIIIFSDDHQFRDEIIYTLIAKFKIKSNYLPKLPINEEIPLEKWEVAFLEFLTLSWKCQKIYGTQQSSFAEEAGIFGGKFHYNCIDC